MPDRKKRKGLPNFPADGSSALQVLALLLQEHPELEEVVRKLTHRVIEEPSFEVLAQDIENAIAQVDEGDVLKSSGRRYGTYTEPEEAAAQLLSDAFQPFLDDLKDAIERKMEARALALCQAIILALYRIEQSGRHVVVEELNPEFPAESAGWAYSLWLAGGNEDLAFRHQALPGRKFPEEWAQEWAPEWTWLISTGRCLD